MDIDISQLKGKHVYLELLSPDHRSLIRPLAKDERIWEFNKMLPVDDGYDKAYDAYFDTALDRNAMSGQQTFVIRRTKNSEIIGMTRLYEISEKGKYASIGYTWYIPSVWGKVHNRECKLLLLQYVFETLQYNRVELRAVHQNLRSLKAIEKIGAVKEGVLRKHGFRPDGSPKDTVIFGMIDDDWICAKEKLIRLITESEND